MNHAPVLCVPIGPFEDHLVDGMRSVVPYHFRQPFLLGTMKIDPAPTFNPDRYQYHSTELLVRLLAVAPKDSTVLGITNFDLYIPILTFVFGEAELAGRSAIVSTARLRQEFYGLPPDGEMLKDRFLKEVIHELGHVRGLTHCDNYECAMAASHSVEQIDLKAQSLCDRCAAFIHR